MRLALLFLSALFAGHYSLGQNESCHVGLMGETLLGSSVCAGVLYFFPVYYLNKFASNAKAAFKNNDSETLTTSLEYLKSHYKSLESCCGCFLSLPFNVWCASNICCGWF
jgi:hypothetical protein